MLMKKKIRSNKPFLLVLLSISGLIFAVFFGGGCANNTESSKDDRPVFAVAVEPHAFLLDRIGGEQIRSVVLVPPGKEPEYYQATPQKIASLTRAKVLFLTGMPFEENLVPKLRSLAKDLEFVDLRQGIELRLLELHSHGSDEASSLESSASRSTGHVHHAGCSHDGLDPHIWFAPGILKIQAQTVFDALVASDPDSKEIYRANFDRLLEEIETTRQTLVEKLEKQKGRTVYVFHPSYGYFCDEFGLHQRAIEYEGKTPKSQQITALTTEFRSQTLDKNGQKKNAIIFVQPEFNQSPARAIAEATGGKTVVHSSLERNVLQSMLEFADLLNSGF